MDSVSGNVSSKSAVVLTARLNLLLVLLNRCLDLLDGIINIPDKLLPPWSFFVLRRLGEVVHAKVDTDMKCAPDHVVVPALQASSLSVILFRNSAAGRAILRDPSAGWLLTKVGPHTARSAALVTILRPARLGVVVGEELSSLTVFVGVVGDTKPDSASSSDMAASLEEG